MKRPIYGQTPDVIGRLSLEESGVRSREKNNLPGAPGCAVHGSARLGFQRPVISPEEKAGAGKSYLMARQQELMRDFAGALESYNECIKSDPLHVPAMVRIANSKEWPEHLGVGKPHRPDERVQGYMENFCLVRLGRQAAVEKLKADLKGTSAWKHDLVVAISR